MPSVGAPVEKVEGEWRFAMSTTAAVPENVQPVQANEQLSVSHDAQRAEQATADHGTITCPLTGEQIPPCCCPLNK
jgi:hypothetical protein